jgi:thiol:disulfide interchange protein DsbC
MKKKIAALTIAILGIVWTAGSGLALTPEESLKKNFPSINVDDITASNVPGLYEVTSGQRIFYYSPEAESIVGGPIIMKGGRNITQEKFQAMEEKRLAASARKLKEIKLDQALKIGRGKHTVVEITNPDCGYCRKAAEFFQGRTDVTKHIFFYPFAGDKNAEAKVRYILCAKDVSAAYRDAMSGKLDDMKFKTCDEPAVEAKLRAHREIATQLGTTGTPFFFINGQPVVGANIPLLEKLLGDAK